MKTGLTKLSVYEYYNLIKMLFQNIKIDFVIYVKVAPVAP